MPAGPDPTTATRLPVRRAGASGVIQPSSQPRSTIAGEFRKIVGRVQRDDGALPLVAIDEVVPVRDQIIDRAAFMAERDAAIHATRRLRPQRRLRQRMHELSPRLPARSRLVIAAVDALDLHKSGRLTHPFAFARTAPSKAGQYC